MNTFYSIKVGILLVFTAFLLQSEGQSQEKAGGKALSVAVLDFQTKNEKTDGADAATLLSALLSANDNLVMVERSELSKIFSESELTLSGTVSAADAAKVGQLTGAKVIVTGRMFEAGDKSYVVAKVISAETSRVFGHTAKYVKGESYADGIETLAETIKKTLETKSTDLLAKVESPEDRLIRLKKLVAGKKLPSVFVNIPEEHLSRRIPDPAAQVEIQKTLQDLGFPLTDKSDGAGAIITGEAFSELAGRRGNLISCRARLEVKIEAKGKIKVDRQTSVAVDLAENIAAKSALQNAGSTIVERLIVQLTAL